jgi:hypothetical protein
MNFDDKQQALADLITITYENMGFAVLNAVPHTPGVYKLEVIDATGIKEVLVTVLLHMALVNPDAPAN